MKANRFIHPYIWLAFSIVVAASVLGFPVETHAASSSTNWKNRLAVQGGLASVELAGMTGASADRANASYYAFSFTRAFFGGWINGLQYSSVPGISIKPFILTSNAEGEYKITFTRVQWLSGFKARNFRGNLILGMEKVAWSGSPDLGLKESSYFHYGASLSYDVIGDNRIRVPVYLTVLRHPERAFEFESAPSDSVTASAGTEFSLGAGLSVDF